jgi:protein tyrosine phosphatase (PTP) superfamily phosphohydrolase (DUF442 family)
MKRTIRLLLIGLLVLTGAGCQREQTTAAAPEPAPAEIKAEGLHNVFRITDKLLSGSSPDGDEGFRSLDALGVKTIISVDGAHPDLESAHKYGLHYVHLPIGYDGMTRQRALQIAKAVRDLPGLVYIHCHHGKHRGPAAAAAAHLCLDGKCTVDEAVAEMRRAGTDPRYTGLYEFPESLARPTAQELDSVPADFPEAASVPDLVQIMVAIDGRWDNLKWVKEAGWKTPPDHPDLDPPHEALQLVEQFREASRLKESAQRSDEFRRWLATAEVDATELERALRLDHAAADSSFAKVGAMCVQCHGKYRDAPKGR